MMKTAKRSLAVLLALLLALAAFSTPVSALDIGNKTNFSFKETVEHRFYQAVDALIVGLGAVLNGVIPGLNWVGKVPKLKDYTSENFYAGKASFDAAPAEDAAWEMGFSSASFLESINPTDGSYYISGALAPLKGNAPEKVLDDQGVNTFALSDGTTTVTYSSIDGFGLTRGDVLEIRSRLSDFAKEYGVDSINVSALHQHSCIDTLGLGVPLVPALLKNPASILLKQQAAEVGRNPVFMENLYRAVTDTVIEAVRSMRTGTLSYGSVDIGKYINDKRDPQAFDPNFNRLRFVPDDPEAKEIWVGQTCIHPTTVGSGSKALSADYPHYIEQYVNENAGADFVFIQGAELAISSHANQFQYDANGEANARAAAMGETLGKEIMSITDETVLSPLLNLAFDEVTVPVKNPVHIIAGREGLLASVMCRKGLGYVVVTELGYMELGGKLGVVLAPGEMEPALLWGGAVAAENSWTGKSWDYAPWAQTSGAEKLLCFGLCNDQIGYVLCDNDYRSMLTENEEINAVSNTVGSLMTEAFEALITRVKG